MEDGDGGAESVPDLSHRCAVLASQRFYSTSLEMGISVGPPS